MSDVLPDDNHPSYALSPLNISAGEIVVTPNKLFTLISRIAVGASGDVWKANETDGNTVAVKVLKHSEDGDPPKKVLQLLHLLKDFAPQALRFVAVPNTLGRLGAYQCVIDSLYGCDLRMVIENNLLYPLPREDYRAVIWQILTGLEYLHELGVVHGDIKPENVLVIDDSTTEIRRLQPNGLFRDTLVFKTPAIKICDVEDVLLPLQKPHHLGGSAGYRSPEIERGAVWGNKADIFALGCTAYELLIGRELFPEQKEDMLGRASSDPFTLAADFKHRMSIIRDRPTASFIRKAVTLNARRRPNASILLRHAFFAELARK